MRIKQTMKRAVIMMALVFGLVLSLHAIPVMAAASDPGNNGCGTDTTIIKCDNVDVTQDGVENTAVWSILLTAINILTAGIGVVAVAGIVYASILYTSAGGNAEQTKKAMTIIADIVIGVLAYALMYAVLNFLIPGGLFA